MNIGLQHNIGIGGACVIGMYKLAYPEYKQHKTNGDGKSEVAVAKPLSGAPFQSDAMFGQVRIDCMIVLQDLTSVPGFRLFVHFVPPSPRHSGEHSPLTLALGAWQSLKAVGVVPTRK